MGKGKLYAFLCALMFLVYACALFEFGRWEYQRVYVVCVCELNSHFLVCHICFGLFG